MEQEFCSLLPSSSCVRNVKLLIIFLKWSRIATEILASPFLPQEQPHISWTFSPCFRSAVFKIVYLCKTSHCARVLCLWMSVSFLRESFFNIHLQVTNKGLVSPFGLSPAIWELEYSLTSDYIPVLLLTGVDIVESEPWSLTSPVTLIGVQGRQETLATRGMKTLPQTWWATLACQSRAQAACVSSSVPIWFPLPDPSPLPPFVCLFFWGRADTCWDSSKWKYMFSIEITLGFSIFFFTLPPYKV